MKIFVSVNALPNNFFYWLLVVYLAIFKNRSAGCFQSNIACRQEDSKCRPYQTLLWITHNKIIKCRLKVITSLLCCSNNQKLALQIWRLSKARTYWLIGDFRNFSAFSLKAFYCSAYQIRTDCSWLNSLDIMEFSSWKRFIVWSIDSVVWFIKEARASIVLIIESVQFVLQNCEKLHSVRAM